jgi:hypothetical protein
MCGRVGVEVGRNALTKKWFGDNFGFEISKNLGEGE